jgi:hypothetical protein
MKNTQAAARENNCRNTSPTAIASQAGEWTTAVRCATLNSVVVVQGRVGEYEKFMNAFVRAVKPTNATTKTCCGATCCN